MKFRNKDIFYFVILVLIITTFIYLGSKLRSEFYYAGTQKKLNIYSIEDVKKHNSIKDCWVIYENLVYNLSGSLDNNSPLSNYCGKNITSLINNNLDNNMYFKYFPSIFEDRKIGYIR